MSNRFTSGLKTSLTDEWPTPDYVFNTLNEEFHFTLDVCADDDNHKTPAYFTKKEDGLKQNWRGICWMNPPYGREISKWVEKAYKSSLGGGYSCSVPFTSQNGYQMVEGLCHVCL